MKYGNKRTTVGGLTFDSKREAERWGHLCILERMGRISGLRRQVRFELAPAVTFEGAKRAKLPLRYFADFEYIENGVRIVEDVKSSATAKKEAFVIKRHLMKSVHGIDVRITT